MVWTKKDREKYGEIIEGYGFVLTGSNSWKRQYNQELFAFVQMNSTQKFSFYFMDENNCYDGISFSSDFFEGIFSKLMNSNDLIFDLIEEMNKNRSVYVYERLYQHSLHREEEEVFTRAYVKRSGAYIDPEDFFSTSTGFSDGAKKIKANNK